MDGKGITHVLQSGACAAQLGTAYLFCPEANISALYLSCLQDKTRKTTVTNIYSGRPARGIVNRFIQEVGPLSDVAPDFPYSGKAVLPLRKKAEALGSSDFSQMWAGTGFASGRRMPAGELTKRLAFEAMKIME